MVRFIFSLLLAASLALAAGLGAAAPVSASQIQSMVTAALPGFNGVFAGSRPNTIGIKDGKLAPCPGSPNCVVSQGAQDKEHAIAPIAYSGSQTDALNRLKAVIAAQPRTAVIEERDDYLYAEFSSRLMGFVDDVEFFFDPGAPVIQVRSASRLGESDLGVNRKRIETIRAAFAVADPV
ncbi:MAG TPA: DUF1499 domain-containing protein [Trichocoleus sp.]